MEKLKRFLCLTLVLALPASFAMPAASAAAAVTAVTMQLTKTEGRVEISKSNGKPVSMREGMRLYSGYNIATSEESYAWINLDSAKLTKVDAISSVEVRKSGSKLEINISSGSVFFEVSEPLEEDESLNISTSTMTVGIRGTSGWVRITDQWVSQVCILEGTVQCVVSDPVTGQLKSAVLTGGDMAQCVVYPQDQPGDKCDILMDRATTWDIPGFILADLVYNVDLCDKILEEIGLDVLADLATVAGGDPSGRMPDGGSASPEVLGLARDRLEEEEAETVRRLEEIREKEALQENNISKDPVWGETPQPTLTPTPAATSVPTATPAPAIPPTPSEPDNGPSGDDAPEETPAPEEITYTLTLAYNGIPVSSAADSVVTDIAGRANLPDISYTPNTDGTLAFRGWFTAPSGGTQVTSDTVFTSDQTIYAQWEGWDWEVTTRTRAVYPTLRIFGWGPMKDYAESAGAPWSAGEIGLLVVEDGIENVGAYAFATLETLEIAEIADSVTRIGTHAFYQCAGLTSIAIPETVTAIGDSAFYGCSGLTSFAIPSGVTSIDDSAFYGCSGLTSIAIPETVTTIGGSAFQGCAGLTSVTISDKVTSIGGSAFELCTSLTRVDIPGSVEEISFRAFASCGALTDIYFDGTRGEWDAANPGNQAQVPDDCTVHCSDDIEWTFDADTGTLRIYGAGPMEDYFDATLSGTEGDLPPWVDHMKDIRKIVIEEGVTRIGNDAFYAMDEFLRGHCTCPNLTEISIPASVTSIGEYAFRDCTSLASITIPADVTTIGAYAFDRCTSLKDIYFGGTKEEWENVNWNNHAHVPDDCTVHCVEWEFDEDTNTLRIYGTGRMEDYTWEYIPSGGNSPPWSILSLDYDIQNVVIEEGITRIGDHAFYTNGEMRGEYTCPNLASVSIPNSVTSIGEYAFCKTGLVSIDIPGSVTSIGESVFLGCTRLTDINFGGTREEWDAANPGNQARVAAGVIVHCTDTVVFDANGGTLTLADSSTAERYTTFISKVQDDLPLPTRENYTFAGGTPKKQTGNRSITALSLYRKRGAPPSMPTGLDTVTTKTPVHSSSPMIPPWTACSGTTGTYNGTTR